MVIQYLNSKILTNDGTGDKEGKKMGGEQASVRRMMMMRKVMKTTMGGHGHVRCDYKESNLNESNSNSNSNPPTCM